MRTDLDHLSDAKQRQLHKIVSAIRTGFESKMGGNRPFVEFTTFLSKSGQPETDVEP